MREKFEIAKKFRISRKNFSKNVGYTRLYSKCYRAYVAQCILKWKTGFQLTFKGKYIPPFSKRLKDWCCYVLDNIYKFYLVHVTPKDQSTFRKFELINFKVLRPVHPKAVNPPNEEALKDFLEENGFKIVEKHLCGVDTIYDIARI